MSHSNVNVEQPKSFEFSSENFAIAEKIIAKYPANRQQSAVLSLLYLVQDQAKGWIPRVAMDYIASLLHMPPIRVYEVASFYTMFNLAPVGEHLLQVCTTTPCWLRGSEEIVNVCKKELGIEVGETTADGKFSLCEVECLGACVNAPMVQINNKYYYEDLTPELMKEIIAQLRKGQQPTVGSQIGRQCSSPVKEGQ
jgi:NADH-quinone oxidoreductase subunit E